MGTTVTSNLALIKPDINESIQANLPTFAGWAVQNGANCDVLDALFRHSTGTWTPTWTADTTNPTLGSGNVLEGKYLRLWPKMIIGFIRLDVGTTSFAAGSGLYRFAPPATMAPELSNFHGFMPVGKAILRDFDTPNNTTACQVMYEMQGSSSLNLLTIKKHDGDSWRNTTPFTLAQGDQLSAYFMYPTTDT